jgi:hypothetical protein
MGFLTIKKHFLLYYFKLTGVMNVGINCFSLALFGTKVADSKYMILINYLILL